jgi:DNA repair protein RadC
LVREYLTTLQASQQREFFVMVCLDARHRVNASDVLFAIYPGSAMELLILLRG